MELDTLANGHPNGTSILGHEAIVYGRYLCGQHGADLVQIPINVREEVVIDMVNDFTARSVISCRWIESLRPSRSANIDKGLGIKCEH